jgi:hypothetical protein
VVKWPEFLVAEWRCIVLLVRYELNLYMLYRRMSEFLATDPEVRVRFPALPHFLRSSGSGTGSTEPRECNRRTT